MFVRECMLMAVIFIIVGLFSFVLYKISMKSPRFNPVDIERRLVVSKKYCDQGVATACDAVYRSELKRKI